MKYLYISRNQSISFNEDYWYINGIEQKRPIEETRTTEELAKNCTKTIYEKCIDQFIFSL